MATDSPIQRDQVQEKLAIFARLEKEFCDLIEAYEIMLVERQHLEELLVGQGELESLDDLELVGQYYKALQDTSQVFPLSLFGWQTIDEDALDFQGGDCEIDPGIGKAATERRPPGRRRLGQDLRRPIQFA